MSDNQKNDFGSGLKDLFKMGVGAVASAVEKGKEFVSDATTEGTETNKALHQMKDDLTAKGSQTINTIKTFGGDMLEKLQNGEAELDVLLESLESFTKEELARVKAKVEELLAQPDETPEEDAPAEDAPVEEAKPNDEAPKQE